jgi:hypothetical protein
MFVSHTAANMAAKAVVDERLEVLLRRQTQFCPQILQELRREGRLSRTHSLALALSLISSVAHNVENAQAKPRISLSRARSLSNPPPPARTHTPSHTP